MPGSGLNPASAIGMGIGLIGSIGQLFGNAKANKELRALQASDPSYNANPLAQQRLGLAQTLLNARMPGSASMERNIYGNQANTISNINRNSTDSSQALALGAAAQGSTNQAFDQLGQQEAQDYQRRYSNLVGAQEGAINEGDKVFQDNVRRFGDRGQIQGAINANRQNTWQSISNLGFGISDLAQNGGFGGKGGSGGMGSGGMSGGWI